MSHDYVIIAFFDDELTARLAEKSLKDWDQDHENIKLGACGVIVENKGKLKTHVGRWGAGGAWVGAVMGIISAVFSGGLGIIGGAVAGGVNGSFFRKASHLQENDFEIIMEALHAGKGVLVATCDSGELNAMVEQVKSSGGDVSTWELPAGTLDETAVW